MSELLNAAKRAAPGLNWELTPDGKTASAKLRSGPDRSVFITSLNDGIYAAVGRTYTKGKMTLDEATDFVRAKLRERRDALNAALEGAP